MNVLSLFDGISCGQVALERIGVKVDNYYASEIDENAIKVTKANFPNTIQIGDVEKVKSGDLPTIDLLMGGSPCQGFSKADKQLNFVDPRSRLFFEFVRLLKECKPKYFLLENVKMKKEFQDIITSYLGVEPIEIDSALVSAQRRKRLYWTNIPDIKQPKDKEIYFHDVVDKNRDWSKLPPWVFTKWGNKQKLHTLGKITDKKSHTLTTNRTHSKNHYRNQDSTMITKLTVNEAEMLQTMPVGYTSVLPVTRAFHALGNGWTVDVIAHILKGVRDAT